SSACCLGSCGEAWFCSCALAWRRACSRPWSANGVRIAWVGGFPMTPLRQRLIDDLQRRNYAAKTIPVYVPAVARFARHFGRSPDQLAAEHVRQYQLHLLQQRASWSRFNQAVAALRFFYAVTLQRDNVVVMLPYGKKPKALPDVLSTDE